ncbi:MAG: glycoside hydrolase family 30 protein [Rikenellaceae bacterium]
MKLKFYSAAIAVALFASCSNQSSNVTLVSTSETDRWNYETAVKADEATASVITVDKSAVEQEVIGFGACFNELGWTSLSLLSPEDRESILKELFQPSYGANFNICRMPLGANDFSLDWYSYCETDGDFDMKTFSIDNDKNTLIPFINAAKKYNPSVKIWASPWSPPTWMKYNGHYAAKYNGDAPNPKYHNGLAKDNQGFEGTDMFKQEDKYLSAYALYFSKFIEAYKQEGIDIFAVMPQNEFNSDQVFPSCCWQAQSLANFIGSHLGPKMEEQGVEIMFGTMERPDAKLVDTILTDPKSKQYIKGVGFQWAGRDAIPTVHKNYPDMLLYQTEQECGDGKNDWEHLTHSWELLKHYFDNGTSAYMYWNISLEEGGISRWGWAQNSLVVVDPETKTYEFSSEYYLMKHISHFVAPGSKYLKLDGVEDALAFVTPENQVVMLLFERTGKNRTVEIVVDGKKETVVLPKHSINTVVL